MLIIEYGDLCYDVDDFVETCHEDKDYIPMDKPAIMRHKSYHGFFIFLTHGKK